MDEHKLLRQRANGAEARRLWENSMIQGFFTELDEEIKKSWDTSKVEERDRREELYYFMRAVEALKQRFKAAMFTGEVAGKQLLEAEEQRKRAKA